MNRDVWGLFHDGSISRIDRTASGTLRLEIDIEYLRDMFPEPGRRFIVTLTGCSKFVYQGYGEQSTSDISRIQDSEPEILYVKSVDPLVLDCASGTLELAYDEMTVALESGQSVSEEALATASETYWKRWSRRT